MPTAGVERAPISDCVQNQSARTIPVTSKRKNKLRRWLELPGSVIGLFSSLARDLLFVQRALSHFQGQSTRFAEVELSRAQVRKILNAHELVLTGPPQRGQIALPQFLEAFFQFRFIE